MNKQRQRKINELRYKFHKETKEDRLEELKEKISEQEITDVLKYGAICNSVFGKKRILSRQRINKIILSKQDWNRL